jgi:hypothetical protein
MAAVVVALLAGCGRSGAGASGGGTGTAGLSSLAASSPAASSPAASSPAASSPAASSLAASSLAAPSPAASSPAAQSARHTPAPPAVPALTCAQLAYAAVGSATISYNGYHDSIPLGGGRWSGEDGATVTLQKPCGIGDLNGDGAKDAVGVVALTTGGTGTFYTLVVWRNAAGQPECAALADLGDRNPVLSVSVSAQRATVVYLTRTDGSPMAMVNVRRTAVHRLVGTNVTEVSHTDVPYSG